MENNNNNNHNDNIEDNKNKRSNNKNNNDLKGEPNDGLIKKETLIRARNWSSWRIRIWKIQASKSSSATGCTRCRLGNTSTLVPPAADDLVICQNACCGQVIVLPSQHLVCPVADYDFVICWKAHCGQVLVSPRQHLVCPTADPVCFGKK